MDGLQIFTKIGAISTIGLKQTIRKIREQQASQRDQKKCSNNQELKKKQCSKNRGINLRIFVTGS